MTPPGRRRLPPPPARWQCAALFAALPAFAGPALGQEGSVRIASRNFLVGEVPAVTRDDPNRLPLTSVGWIAEVVDADPLLGPLELSFNVWQQRASPSWLLRGEDGAALGVPAALLTQALRVMPYDGDSDLTVVNFRPATPDPDFLLTCVNFDPATLAFAGCTIRVAYPADPTIELSGRITTPVSFPGFASDARRVADRLLEITLCLDVTEAPPADPVAALAALRQARPDLAGCAAPLSS